MVLLLLGVAAVRAQEAEDPVDAALARLRSADAKERTRAARALGRLGGDRATAALRRTLKDDAEPVRLAAAAALAGQGATDAALVSVLTACLRSEEWYTRWQACLALGPMGEAARAATPGLLNAALDERLDVTREAVLALARIDPADATVQDAFVRLLQSGRGCAPGLVLDHLQPERVKEILPWLGEEFTGNAHHLRERAYAMLVKAGSDGAPLLGAGLTSAEANVRLLAIDGLVEVKATGAVDALCKVAAYDVDLHVRREAMLALGHLGDERAVTPILRGIQGEPDLLPHALVALRTLGPKARAAAPAVLRLLDDWMCADEVLKTLKALGFPELEKTLVLWEQTGELDREYKVRLRLPADPADEPLLRALRVDLNDNTLGGPLAAALRAVLDESAEEHWRDLLVRGTEAQKICAAVLLGHLAREPKKALPLLEEAYRTDRGRLHEAAAGAIRRLRLRE